MHTTLRTSAAYSTAQPVGELAGLIVARLIAPADRLWRTLAEPRSEPLVEVTADGRLRTDAGHLHPGPREAITWLEACRYAPIAWQCFTTANGTSLETLRQLAHPQLTDQNREPGALAPLIRAGHLQTGTPLIFEMTAGRGRPGEHVRLLATRAAEVTADGWLRLDDGSSYASPSPAAAACCGKLTNGWKAWHQTDGRTLHTVRARAGITPPPRPGR
jgi:Restriction Enzyme Adenine Methylase Associated/Domain of unknown function (DUF4357)